MATKRFVVTHTKGSSVATVRPYGSSTRKTVSVSSLPSKVKKRL